MALILNASSRPQKVKVFGSWFAFAPKQVKALDPDKVQFLSTKCSEKGFVELPEKFADPDYKTTAKGKEEFARYESMGVQARIAHLEWHKNNELHSLRKDMDQANIKSDVTAELSASSLAILKDVATELSSYKRAGKDSVKEKQEQLAEIEKLLED